MKEIKLQYKLAYDSKVTSENNYIIILEKNQYFFPYSACPRFTKII